MRKNDLVIYIENKPHIKELTIGKVYTLANNSSVKLSENFNSYIESSNIVELPKPIYKALLKKYDEDYLETIFKDIAIFKQNYIQDYLKKNSLGLLEHMEKFNEKLIPYLIEQKKLYKRDLFSIVNIFKPIEIENFFKIYEKSIGLEKLSKSAKNEFINIYNFINSIPEKKSFYNKYNYCKYFESFVNDNIENLEKRQKYIWSFKSMIKSISGYIDDEKRDKSALIYSCVDLINTQKHLNLDLKLFDGYIDLKSLRKEDVEYWNEHEKYTIEKEMEWERIKPVQSYINDEERDYYENLNKDI